MVNKAAKFSGFTLIELLVVVAIIGLLSAIALVNFNIARAKARDSVRKQDLSQLRKALEIYYSTHNAYPSTAGAVCWGYTSNPTGDPCGITNGPGGNGDWIPGLVASGAISALPQEPSAGQISTNSNCGGGWHKSFLYRSDDGSHYKLIAHCGPEGVWDNTDPFFDKVRTTWAWQVCDAEPACSW